MPRRRGGPEGAEDREARLEAELEAARVARDQALAALAKERELVNALRLRLRQGEEAAVPRFPSGTGLGPPPLRYELADKLNDSARRALGPVHSAARKLIGRGRKPK